MLKKWISSMGIGGSESSPREKKGGKESMLAPESYFSTKRFADIKAAIQRLGGGINVESVTLNSANEIDVSFSKDSKKNKATFAVNKEEGKTTYALHASIQSEGGKKIFEKKREGLSHIQIEPALIFVFHQAFDQ